MEEIRLSNDEASGARLHELEAEVDRLTALVERYGHVLQGLSDRIDALDRTSSPVAFETVAHLALGAGSVAGTSLAAVPEFDRPGAGVALERIHRNAAILRGLELSCSRRALAGDMNGALAAARVSAEWAVFQHAGVFVSAAVEDALRHIGESLLSERPVMEPRPHEIRRVLHVTTVASPVGGHTRMMARWARLDSGRHHEVVVTEQRDAPIPEFLSLAVDGRISVLEAPTPAERVLELNDVMRSADLVILHPYSYDCVTAAACADHLRRPRTMLMNHADCFFWIGAAAFDEVIDFREIGVSHSIRRRGIPPARTALLPLPIDRPQIAKDKHQTRRRLGIPEGSTVLCSMALGAKFNPFFGIDFVELVAPILDQRASVVLLVVGQEATRSIWRDAAGRWPGRVYVVDATESPEVYLDASDVYLDSAPVSSQTALLEAAIRGIPVLSLHLPGWDMLVVGCLEIPLPVENSIEGWRAALCRILDAPEAARAEARVRAAALVALHCSDGWRDRLEQLYRTEPPDRATWLPPADHLEAYDLVLSEFQFASRLGRDVITLLASMGLLPEVLG